MSPPQRLLEPFRPQCQVKPVLEWVSGRFSETLRKPFRIAVIAACADLCAAGDGIPSGIRPFDSGVVSHLRSQSATRESYTYPSVCGQILVLQCFDERALPLGRRESVEMSGGSTNLILLCF